ncbi:MAG: hypothetical protein A2745_03540 [Candidatus Harrisonbacteria bacterium RIFCSPHIGHO2_01_FULL_44_13]|uniref:Toxin HicA n=1 Tax=Candidatus Harrisonbacteria bacterium RIFCSPLOWO2_01_FULL_44_18 TaxID=1798407 RepID=A0A1G1ZKU9_9BACT|nr:MAG: hypothetical protein A2745_03540 [Candidatus Harrisonbacteria bacterium RIFCSPHIGHO2_01_FULL_44_13]OGY65258.1 MAG: hypothetical protein A3A16_01905 [Candidatus Harrisonbacteria bacterium RIFCSPLOWO2_01_FULL_44_18]
MTHLPVLKAKDLIRVLEKLGFQKMRQNGSHLFFQHADGRTTLVSVHAREDIGRGLLHQILREIKLSPEEFLKLL